MARKKKVSPGNRLVAYYRYSGGSQQTEQSIEGQRRDCEAYARRSTKRNCGITEFAFFMQPKALWKGPRALFWKV